MTSIVINGKRFTVASCWAEVTTRQYIRIIRDWEPEKDIADRDYFILLNILTDGKFAGMENTIENQVTLTSILGWVVTEPFQFSEELPKVLEIGGKIHDIPEDPRELSIGQNIHLRRDFIDKSTYLEENIAIAVAVYMQPIIDNSLFKLKRAEKIANELEAMPASLIYPIGFFLLRRVMRFGQKPEKTWPAILTSLRKRLSRMLPGSPRSTGSTVTKTST
jgi:hypothetical protein